MTESTIIAEWQIQTQAGTISTAIWETLQKEKNFSSKPATTLKTEWEHMKDIISGQEKKIGRKNTLILQQRQTWNVFTMLNKCFFPKWLSAHFIKSCHPVYDKCPVGPQKVIKTHSEPLQNEFQGSNFPSCIGQKRPPMAPQRQPTQPRVILWVTEQDLAGQWALASKFHYQDNDALIFDRLWPSWEFPMCNLDMWGVFSGVKFNSKHNLFSWLWPENASLKS